MSDEENNNLQGAFGTKGVKATDMQYNHPYEEGMLKQISEIISQCYTGYSLWAVGDVLGTTMKILKGKGNPGYAAKNNTLYLYAPTSQDQAKPKQILDLIYAARLAEQHSIGFAQPDDDTDILTYASALHAKNLDAVTFMCKVVYELKDSEYFTILLDELSKNGHSMVYKAYTSNVEQEKLVEAYAES